MDLDVLVRDPRFLPYSGWLDDPRVPPYTGNPSPAIQQNREEFVEFVSKLNQRRHCLQIGLGTVGASQLVFSALFSQAWTIENMTSAPVSNIIRGDSHDPAVVAHCATLAPFDLLFIDGDKSYGGLRADYNNYAPMVGQGGVIAFHDAIPWKGNESTQTVFAFIEELKAKGHQYTTIGTLLGIAWCYKGEVPL